MSRLFLDFELHSELDIREVGAYAYAAHASTVPLCCAWAIDGGPIQLWKHGEKVPTEWNDPSMTFVAHNHEVEDQVLRECFEIKHLFWYDTAELASMAGLPRSLSDAAEALKLEHKKADSQAMLQLARPRKPSRDNPDRFWRPETRPDLFARLYEYCKQDVEVMRELFSLLPPLPWLYPTSEQVLHDINREMNFFGVVVDTTAVLQAKEAVAKDTARLKARFNAIMPGVNPKSPIVCAEALELPNVQKATVREALKTATGSRREALEILKILATAATAKLNAFQQRTTAGRLRGALVFHGAGRTGRWSSMGVQLQNLIRGLGVSGPDWDAIDTRPGAMDRFFGALEAGILEDLYPSVIRAVASAMRGFLTGPFLVGDFSQIEARCLAKLASQLDLLDDFKFKRDPYKAMAGRIYGKPVTGITKDERFMGKQAVLGCGYGLGPGGFIRMLSEIYGVVVTVQEAERIVGTYRGSNPKIVQLWWAVERLAKQCVLEDWRAFQTSSGTPGIACRMFEHDSSRRWLCVRIPSGRTLWYFDPKMRLQHERHELTYWGRNAAKGGKWEEVHTYGGKLVENITQATARDIMADAMRRLRGQGFDLRLTVHDEVIAYEHRCDDSRLLQFKQVMEQPPIWWPDIPLEVDAQFTRRYQK